MALANYALPADVTAQLTSVGTASIANYSTQITGLLSTASRAIDGFCDRYFYSDGVAAKYFDGDDTRVLLVPDFYGGATVKVASFENADPASTDWVTLTGDGITPPSDFFFEPVPGEQLPYVGKSGDSHARPWYRIRIPQTPPQTSQTFASQFPRGLRTVSVAPTAGGWGWAAIPDEINLVCVKTVIRLLLGSQVGYTGMAGDPELSPRVDLTAILDAGDLYTLGRFKRESY